MNGAQTRIVRCDAVGAVFFEVVEKRQDDGRITTRIAATGVADQCPGRGRMERYESELAELRLSRMLRMPLTRSKSSVVGRQASESRRPVEAKRAK